MESAIIAPIIALFPFMSRFQTWYHAHSPRGQWTLGCAGVIFVVTLCLYALGLFSYVARPQLTLKPPAATIVLAVPTIAAVPTYPAATAQATFVLPVSTLDSTPTQAPIPTRAPPTITPTPTLGFGASPAAETTTPNATLFFELSQTRTP